MGYFDKITEAAFKEGENGESIYYPNGIIGKGRVIKDPELKKKIFKFHKRLNKYLFPFGVIYGMLLGLGGAVSLEGLIPVIIIGVLVFLRQRFLINGLPKNSAKLTVKEASTKASKSMHPAFLIFLMVNGIICISLGLAIPFIVAKSIGEVQLSVLILVAVGFVSLAISLYLYKLQKSNKEIK